MAPLIYIFMKPIDNFFHTYNARHLNPSEVAKSFIYSENFEKLIQKNHSLILGARGCGKTTLMKMLTLPALTAWEGEMAERIKTKIPFYAVYISTDIYWDVKNQTYSTQLQRFPKFSHLVSVFSVNVNVFKALCDTFKNIITYELLSDDEDKEIELCRLLIKAWKLPLVVPKLSYVVDALNERIDVVNQLIQHVIFNCADDSEINEHDFFNLSFESSIEYIIPIFERIYGLPPNKKWALCFDELEFAPIWLQQKLFTSLRSRTQYIIYKLSSSPILPRELEKSLQHEYGASPGNDVEMIKMWSSKENETFSRKLIEFLLKERGIELRADEYFGTNEIYNKTHESYVKGSSFHKEMMELVSKDDSFRDFLKDYNVDVSNPVPANDRQKDTIFRKIKPIVYYRNFYIDENSKESGKVKYRGRKTGELYSGIEVLSKVCDGNPRWLIGTINSLLVKSNGGIPDKRVQFQELMNSANRFANVIANIPIGTNNSYSLQELIYRLGSYFQEQLLGTEFKMDPKGTFVVDDNEIIPPSILELIEKGASQGAFILLDTNDTNFDFEIKGQRFKLAYLYSLLYKLPLRKYPNIKLSDCIKGIEEDQTQISLF